MLFISFSTPKIKIYEKYFVGKEKKFELQNLKIQKKKLQKTACIYDKRLYYEILFDKISEK